MDDTTTRDEHRKVNDPHELLRQAQAKRDRALAVWMRGLLEGSALRPEQEPVDRARASEIVREIIALCDGSWYSAGRCDQLQRDLARYWPAWPRLWLEGW